MIETYKIVTGKYDPVVAPTLSRSVLYIRLLEEIICKNIIPDMIYESIILVTELLTYGIVCLTGL